MSFFGGGSSAPTPPPPALPEPLPSPASFASSSGTRPAGGKRAAGYGATLMTSGDGVDSSETNLQRKSLLGQ